MAERAAHCGGFLVSSTSIIALCGIFSKREGPRHLPVDTGQTGTFHVKSTIKRAPLEQSVSDLPLFDWRVVVVRPRPRPSTRAGSFVARRYCVDPALADLVADLAGIGSEVR